MAASNRGTPDRTEPEAVSGGAPRAPPRPAPHLAARQKLALLQLLHVGAAQQPAAWLTTLQNEPKKRCKGDNAARPQIL